MKKFKLGIALFLVAVSTALSGAQFEFSRLNYRIITRHHPTPVEKFAAEELNFYLHKIYHKPIKINGIAPQKILFFIGHSPAAARAGFTNLHAKKLHQNGWGIFRRGNHILLAGVDDPELKPLASTGRTNTLLAVYYFLQKYAGVVWFMPGDAGEKILPEAELHIATGADLPRPSFELRYFRLATKEFNARECALFQKRKLSYRPAWSSIGYQYLFLNRWGKNHAHKPVTFGWYEGRRFIGKYPCHFPCQSHPDLVPEVASYLLKQLERYPNLKRIRLFSDAPVKVCECPKCQQRFGQNNSLYVYTLFNAIAQAVGATHPEIGFNTQTKGSSYGEVPTNFQIYPGSVVEVLTGRPRQKDFTDTLRLCREWKKAGAIVATKSYPRYPVFKLYPVINPRYIVKYFQTLQGFSRGELNSEGRYGVPYAFSALNNFVQSEISFDATQSAEKLIQKFCSAAAPGAEKELGEFYAAMEKLVQNQDVHQAPEFDCYTPQNLEYPRQLLDQALHKSPASLHLKKLHQAFVAFQEKMAPNREICQKRAAELNRYRTEIQQHPEIIVRPASDTPTAELPREIPLWNFKTGRDFQPSAATLQLQGHNLQIKIRAFERAMPQLRAKCRTNQVSQIWGDDVFEIFIAPEQQPYPFFQLVVNPNGNYVTANYPASGQAWQKIALPGLDIKSHQTQDYWELTIQIPMTTLTPYVVAGRGRIGIFRSRVTQKTQLSGLRIPLDGSFHNQGSWVSLRIPSQYKKYFWEKWLGK